MEKQEVNIVDLIIFSANLLLCSGIKNVNLIQLFYSAPVLSYPVVLRMLELVNYFIVLKMFTKIFQKIQTNKQTKIQTVTILPCLLKYADFSFIEQTIFRVYRP